VAARFPTNTAEFETLAAALRCAHTDEEADAARHKLHIYARPFMNMPAAVSGARVPKQDRARLGVGGYHRYRVALGKLAVQAMEESR
jgi:hypothetical protein